MIKFIKIKNKVINDNHPAFVIAEIGLNHNGKIGLAKKLIKTAKEAGADAVKFQKRDLKSLYKKDIYKNPNKDSHSTGYLFDIFKRFELNENQFIELKKFCKKLDIIFFASAFDCKSVAFLHRIKVPVYKVPSADLTNIPLLAQIVEYNKPIILSTGMSELKEIDFSTKFLKDRKAKFCLLHCVSAYPTAFKNVNLKMIRVLKKRYQVPVGYSGHERGIIVPIAAIALGANIIEKHFTLNRSWEGPDHNISLTPAGFRKMVDRIRAIELALGTGKKTISRGEVLTREVFAKSLIAKTSIKKGQKITYGMIDVKCPGKGLSPQRIDLLVGKKTNRDLKKDDYFIESDLETR